MSVPEGAGEVAVLGLGRSGTAVARLLLADGKRVYISDSGSSPAVSEAARQLRDIGAAVETGGHDLRRIAHASRVVLSPGIDPATAVVRAARDAGVETVSEVEVALSYLTDTRVIAITGTNGKSTVTAMIGHLLRGLGEDAVAAGNIGTAISDYARHDGSPHWIALEMSSFQLHDTPSITPEVGVLTNLSPDHLDRYASVDDYYADKALLFSNASAQSKWVVNGDDDRAVGMAATAAGTRFEFSLCREADAWLDGEGVLHVMGSPLMKRDEIGLLGDHNAANALAAALAVSVADERFHQTGARSAIAAALGSFRALSHRLEVVTEANGVEWINDSKATNVSSALVAIAGMRRPTVLLLGGKHKGEAYTPLIPAIRENIKTVIAYGEAAPLIEADLQGVVPLERLGADFDEVMRRAGQIAESGDAVLMSPACSSFDMFRNYEERGERFRAIAMEQ
ncbi:MAG: UDP-N-acetylmuramoyl-L-alanine--D-glutamate ligase [Gemmatimonadaceae bacterium]